MRTLSTAISPQYVSNWSLEMALREVLQNYLDTRQQFHCPGSLTWRKGQLIVEDQGPGLALRHLLLGLSEKGEGAIGQFGEGLKLALLVLAREGVPVEIQSHALRIVPRIALDPAFGAETLQLEVTETTPQVGTRIVIACSEATYVEARNHFVVLARPRIQWVQRGRVSLPGGQIYVHGARAGTLSGALFSYHFQGEEARALSNRDRTHLDHSLTGDLVANLLRREANAAVRAALLQELLHGDPTCPPAEFALYQSTYDLDSRRRQAWRRTWNAVAGRKMLMATPQDGPLHAQVTYHGYQSLTVHAQPWATLLKACQIPTVSQVLEESPTLREVPRSRLSPEEISALAEAKRAVQAWCGYTLPPITVVTRIALKSGLQALGSYDRESKRVYLSQPLLTSSKARLLGTLAHEVAHAMSDTDVTVAFEQELTRLIGRLLSLAVASSASFWQEGAA
ncbi:MAG: hypothetical protein ACYC5M_14785 [Anaerolineae bacterium]